MNLIFVGSIYPKYLLDYLLAHSLDVDFAANNYQSALVNGLSYYYNSLKIISSPPISNPGKCSKKMIKSRYLKHFQDTDFYYVGTARNRLWKMLVEFWRIRKQLGIILSDRKEENIACCYSLHSPFLLSLLLYRKKIKKICLVVPDLPEYMSDNTNPFRVFAKKVDRQIINLCIKRIDCFALLSPYMADRLRIKNKTWDVIEGIFHPENVGNIEKYKKKIILYTGQLQKRYGVFDLVEAFMLIPNEDYELWLCGDSYEIEQLRHLANDDPRIKFLGKRNRRDIIIFQKMAHLLVNPRHSSEEFTKYSFPSKTMEYLASGTPVLMSKLPSIPEEYNEFLFFFEDESIIGMKNKIIEICEIDINVLNKKGKEAAKFIYKNKTAISQVSKIVKMLQ